jgi:hypothetical protein
MRGSWGEDKEDEEGGRRRRRRERSESQERVFVGEKANDMSGSVGVC